VPSPPPKGAFACEFAGQYRKLSRQFVDGEGTCADSVFNLSVQVSRG
jgi:hypothetical protein